MYFIVYKITNIINGYEYIGVHATLDPNDNYFGSSKYLKNSIRKYGKLNFKKDIISFHENSESMYEEEARLVNEEYVSRKDTYNVALGGIGGASGKYNGMFGKFHTAEAKRKISEKSKNYHATSEAKELLKILHKNRSKETLEKIGAGNRGKFVSEETRLKISKINKGKKKRTTINYKKAKSKKHSENIAKALSGIKFSDKRKINISISRGHFVTCLCCTKVFTLTKFNKHNGII